MSNPTQMEGGPPTFNIFSALLNNPELLYTVAAHFEVNDYVNLYSISQRFHELINNKLTTSIERNAHNFARESVEVFPFRLYRSLCVYDPQLNPNTTLQQRIGAPVLQARDVPSFRWLRMVRFREETVDSILLSMAEAGHHLPSNMSLILKKIWFLMDIPENARRIAIIHNRSLWSNNDLFLATLFFIKLDMRFTDPMDGGARPTLRRLMMAQPTLSALDMVLLRGQMRDLFDCLQLFFEWKGMPQGLPLGENMFGVPVGLCGRLQREGWSADMNRALLLRPDQLVMKEGIRRDLRMDRWYLDCLLYGNIDQKTGENAWPPSIMVAQLKKKKAMKAEPKESDAEKTKESTKACRGEHS